VQLLFFQYVAELIRVQVYISEYAPDEGTGQIATLVMRYGCRSPVGMTVKNVTALLPDTLKSNRQQGKFHSSGTDNG